MVSRDEYMTFMSAEFDRLDKNHNGELDVKELTQTHATVTPAARLLVQLNSLASRLGIFEQRAYRPSGKSINCPSEESIDFNCGPDS